MALNEKKRAQVVEEDRFSKLPGDVCMEILSTLPLKTISHCRRVSKTWYGLIIHPLFAEIHFARFRDTLPCAIFQSLGEEGTELVDPEFFSTYQTTATAYHYHLKDFTENFTMSDRFKCFDVVGTVNGLICFSPPYGHFKPAPYYICNPITRGYVLLPKSPKIGASPIGSGFGFDSVTNEYKVVRILRILDNSSRDGNEVEIYTLGSAIWRQIIEISVPYVLHMVKHNHVLNGCIHWIAFLSIESMAILAFNMTAEEFNLIPMPPISITLVTFFRYYGLTVLGDCLCFMDTESLNKGTDIWVMKEYGVHSSWVKEYVFQEKYLISPWRGLHEFLELNNNRLLLLNKGGVLSYYDLENKTSVEIKLHDPNGNPVDPKTRFPIYFKGSLLSPKVIEGQTRNHH